MVRILANGDVVQDNDPRVNSSPPKTKRQGYIQHNEDEEEEGGYYGDGHGHAHHGNNQASIFDSLNQRLVDAGLPQWNLGEHVIEPIVYVGFLLAFLLLGFRGILFAAILFAVNKLSQRRGGLSGLWQSFTGGAGNAGRGSSHRGRNRGGMMGRMGRGGGSAGGHQPPRQPPPPGGSGTGNRLGGKKLGSS